MHFKAYSFLLVAASYAVGAYTIPAVRETKRADNATALSLEDFESRMGTTHGYLNALTAAVFNRNYQQIQAFYPCPVLGQDACDSTRSRVVTCEGSLEGNWQEKQACGQGESCYATFTGNDTTQFPTPQCTSEATATLLLEQFHGVPLVATEADIPAMAMNMSSYPYMAFKEATLNATNLTLQSVKYRNSASTCNEAGLSTCIGSEMVKCSAAGANWDVEARCPDDSACYTIPNVDPAAKPFVATTTRACFKPADAQAAFTRVWDLQDIVPPSLNWTVYPAFGL